MRPIPVAIVRIVLALGVAIALLAVGKQPSSAQQPDETFITGSGARHSRDRSGGVDVMQLAVQAGLRSFRAELYWSLTEQERGNLAVSPEEEFYLSEEARLGLSPLLILDYGNKLYDGGDKPRSPEAIAGFTRYAEFVARHFLAKIHIYELWNEWKNPFSGTSSGSTDDYARLLKSVYPALKAIDPQLKLLADEVIMGDHREGGFQKLAQLGLLHFADGISVHPYADLPEDSFRQLRDLEAALRRINDGEPVPLYVTEIGWHADGKPGGVSLERQAANEARILLLARTLPFVKGVWLYKFLDTDGEQNFGLVWSDLTPKPAYHAVAAVTAALAEATFIGRRATASDDDWILRFREPQGQEFWAAWTTKDNAITRFNLATVAETPAPLMIEETGRRAVAHSWWREAHGVSRLDVTVGATPVFLRGDLADTTVVGAAHQDFPGDLR